MGKCLSKNRDSEPNHNAVYRSTAPNHPKPYEPVVHHTPNKPNMAANQHQQNPRPAHKPDTILGKPFEDVKSHYSFGKELGRGQFGVIHLCTENSTGLKYACKSISKRKLVTKNDKEDIKREIQIMQHLSGQQNIVEFKGCYEDRMSVHVCMELCEGGELFDRIIAKGHYSEKAASAVCRSIVSVVHICHFMGVIHRDLKPENFLLSSKDENALLKATDFGLSVFIEEGIYCLFVFVGHFMNFAWKFD